MEKYDKYKDSGFDWIGKIPEHWEIKKIKYLIEDHSGNGFPNSEQGKKGLEYPFYKVSDINQNSMYVDKANNYVSLETIKENKWNIIPKHSVIAAKIGEALRKNHRKITKIDCLIDNNCIGLEPNGIDYRFNFYFQSLIDFDWFVNPGAVPSLSVEKYKQFRVVLPKIIEEQTAIANYLDLKTAKIDELLNQKEQLLELYEEEKTVIINQAVTKGINPDVKLKDSGIDWLGEIPEHWEVKKLKYVVDLNKETLSDKTDDDYQIEYIDIGNVEYGKLKEKPKKLSFEKAPSRARRVVNSGDTLISTVRTYLKAILFIENANDNLIASTGFAVIAPSDNFLPDYLFYILSSENILQSITASSVGVSYPAINASEIGTFYSWFPQKEEQTVIVQFIETEISLINTKAEKTKKLIELLGEYKQSLISEVVTGKIKVV